MRKIEPAMIAYLDKKLQSHGLAQDAIARKDARLLFKLAAEACVGIQEATGKNDGKMVKLIQETVGGASGEPWCMGLVQTCLAYAEAKCEKRSSIVPSEHCQSTWALTPKVQRVKSVPSAGAIAIWADVGKASGHTEIVLSFAGDQFECVGGNTSGTKKKGEAINREGNGCYYTVRSTKSTAKRKLLGFLKPF
jgi:hypothetical protein